MEVDVAIIAGSQMSAYRRQPSRQAVAGSGQWAAAHAQQL
jgi:hypothetical protein